MKVQTKERGNVVFKHLLLTPADQSGGDGSPVAAVEFLAEEPLELECKYCMKKFASSDLLFEHASSVQPNVISATPLLKLPQARRNLLKEN